MDSPLDRLRYRAAQSVRRGSRTVLLTPNPGPRFGNFLYYWLYAHQHQVAGGAYRVQVHEHLEPWLRQLPAIRKELSVEATEIKFFDRREWPPESQLQHYGKDFSEVALRDFIDQYLAHAIEPFFESPEEAPLIINVRRGDFYSNPAFCALYGFNVPVYVDTALRRASSIGRVAAVRVVSDDLDWCRRELDDIIRAAGVDQVYYGARLTGPWGDFTEIATARRLIGANSTFSYWGAYVATLYGGGPPHVLMPRFVSRHPVNAQGATPLLPRWDVVESIDGGWGCTSHSCTGKTNEVPGFQ